MISIRNRRRIILGCTTFLILLMVGGAIFVILQAPDSDRLTNVPSITATPGLVVYGNVHTSNGEGVENVSIYRSYAGYPGELIATTDANGNFESDFAYIPGDEMVTVRADGLGLTYVPEYYFWRHYYGFQRKQCDFIAGIPTETMLPIITK